MRDFHRARDPIAMLVVLFVVVVGCHREEDAAPPPTEVVVTEVKQESIPIILNLNGTLRAVKAIDIIPRVSGYIEERYFEEGAFVKEGDPLYLIDPRPYKAALAGYRAQLAKSRADLRFLDIRAKRYTALADAQVASLEQRDEAVSQAAEMRAQIQLDLANIENAKLDLGYTLIKAPFDGRIQQTQINKGQLVTAQQTILTQLVQIDPMYAIFSLSRAEMFHIQERNVGGIASQDVAQFKAQIVLPNGEIYPREGVLDFLGTQIDPTTDMLEARAVFPNVIDETDNMVLIPGQYVPVRMIVGQQADAIVVPEQTVMQTQAGRHVFVVNAQNEVEERKVEIDRAYRGDYVIASGLRPSERVILRGLQKVKPKAKVKPIPADATHSKADGGLSPASDAAIVAGGKDAGVSAQTR